MSQCVQAATRGVMVRLDGELVSAGGSRTWGDLLCRLDAWVAARQLIVTDVAFDGIDEPAFREADVLALDLNDVVSVDVQSGTPASLMGRCMAEAITATDALSAAAVRVSADFRSSAVSPARRGLAELAEGLGSLMAITGAASLALQVDQDRAIDGDRSVASMLGEMTACLDAMVDAQHATDWLTLAQLLEDRVEPALRSWRPMLEAFATLA